MSKIYSFGEHNNGFGSLIRKKSVVTVITNRLMVGARDFLLRDYRHANSVDVDIAIQLVRTRKNELDKSEDYEDLCLFSDIPLKII